MLTVSDRRWELLCPFGRKEPDGRKSRDRKNERFLIYTGRSYAPVDHILSIISISSKHRIRWFGSVTEVKPGTTTIGNFRRGPV